MAGNKHSVPDKAVTAALALAAERGWRDLALADIAERAGVPLADLIETTPSRDAILDAYVARIDRRVLDGGRDADESPRDRLFDALMRRFQAMAPDRAALAAIARGTGGDPLAVLCGLRRFRRSMALTLEAAGISAAGLSGLVRTQALAGIVLAVARTFLGDDSADLSRTMAALDRILGRAESLAGLVWRGNRSNTSGQAATNPGA